MSVVAAAIVGSAVVGGVVSYSSGKQASNAAQQGASNAAAASIESTRMQIAEIQRQYDYQQKVLLPQIQQQYNAQRAYSDLLGINGPETTYFDPNGQPVAPGGGMVGGGPGSPGGRPNVPDAGGPSPREGEINARIKELNQQLATPGSGGAGTNARRAARQAELNQLTGELQNIQATRKATTPGAEARMGPAGSSGLRNNASRFDPVTGAFRDPNLDPTKLADSSAYRDNVTGNLLAGTSAEDDPYRNYIDNNRIASGNVLDSTMVRRSTDDTMTARRGGDRLAAGAAGTGVYGDTFNASPGYAWTKEEMQRQVDRKNSAGGNYGGRALMEAQRRAEGIANTEYYNWAAGRERDLGRLGAAEATDINRLDTFAGTDLQRGDVAYNTWENQRVADVGRGDEAYQNYLKRREGDATRLDQVGADTDRLRAADLARSDQSYYNYLQNVKDQAGFGGGPASDAVDASQRTGAAVGNAYASGGDTMAKVYDDLGVSNANIAYAQGAGVNNAVQSGMENWITYKTQK